MYQYNNFILFQNRKLHCDVKFILSFEIINMNQGIKLHTERKPCPDPLSGVLFPEAFYSNDEEEKVRLFNTFPSLESALDVLTCLQAEVRIHSLLKSFQHLSTYFHSCDIYYWFIETFIKTLNVKIFHAFFVQLIISIVTFSQINYHWIYGVNLCTK